MKRHYFNPLELLPPKREAITNIDTDAEDAFMKLYSHFEEKFGVSLPRQTIWLLYDPATPLLGIIQEN